MKQYLQRLTPRTEFLVVVLLAFGSALPGNLKTLLSPQLLVQRAPPITDRALWVTVLYELVLMALLGLFLHTRGWTLRRLGLRPSLQDSLTGLGILLVFYAVYLAVGLVLSALWPAVLLAAGSVRLVGGPLSGWAIAATSAVNPVFEEVFVCGYVVCALQRARGAATAINVSAGLRVSYHLYQGAAGVLGIVPMGLIFAYWFSRTGRLWPLIVAHAAQDLIALALAAR